MSSRGSLVIVGTGISAVSHMTIEARAYVERAEKLFYLVSDPTTAHYLRRINETAESLQQFYATGKERLISYNEMVTHIIDAVRKGADVCVAFYGHPGVFTFPSHEAIGRARAEGFRARMLPAISAEDCLFADVGVDPASSGCQSFEATDFLLSKRKFDVNSSLILWQIGCMGDLTFQPNGYDLSKLSVLSEYLSQFYGDAHIAVVYEASHYSFCEPMRKGMKLKELAEARVTAASTLYVPPRGVSTWDEAMMSRLGIKELVETPPMRICVDPVTDESK